MRAKDTVMKNDFELQRKYKPVIIDNEGGHGEWSIERLLSAQAEITWKAGVKEVVDLIGKAPFEHNYSMHGHQAEDCFACEYEVKLKEWGINED